jgi:predicted outer membrane protein
MNISEGVRSKILMISGGVITVVVLFVAATAGRTGTAAGIYRPDSSRLARAVVTEEGGDVISDSGAKRAIGTWLTDANVLSLLAAINRTQIQAADVVLSAWHSDTVRGFAASMAREHAEIARSIDSVATQAKLAPIAPAVTGMLSAPFLASIDTLRGNRGMGLDRAYVRQQLTSHQAMAMQVTQLGTVAQRPEVQGLVSALGARLGSQVERAKALDAEFVKSDSIKAAAKADSVAKAEERRAAKAAAKADSIARAEARRAARKPRGQ